MRFPTSLALGLVLLCLVCRADDPPGPYSVFFDLGEHGEWTGGGELTQTVPHGTAAVAPEFTVAGDWLFTGWDGAFTAVTANLILTALYAARDADNDHLPDWWERNYLGGLAQHRADDPDRDGFTNWEEFVAGTHPDDNQSYPRDRAALVWQDAVHRLRVIGRALERYRADHGPDALPGRLMYLVDQGYLDADMLLAVGDESGGTNPHPFVPSGTYDDVFEDGASFFYETSEAHCPWSLPGYEYTAASTWYDVKMYQLAHGRGAGQPYDRRAFPVVRFLWVVDDKPTAPSYYRYRTTLNLAMDCRTVFAAAVNSWENQSDAFLPDDPATLCPLPDTPIVARYTVPLHIPLWFAVKDVASTHGLRLVPTDGARDGAIIGEIRDLYYVVTPDIDTPTAFTVTVEWDDGTGAVQQASFDIAVESGPDDEPHTVTYLPGLHGTFPGGVPVVEVIVEYGSPVPVAPAIVPEAGWTHVGWEWTPGARSAGPVTVTQDWTATARYAEGVPAAPSWQLDLALGGTAPATLTFGMRADATDGWDAGIDGHAPPPAPGLACLAADDLALFYSADYRAPATTAEFLLLVDNPEEEPLMISWHTPALPDRKFLSIYEVILNDLPSGRDAIARRPVGYSALDMAATASLAVPAGASRSYVIRYGDELVFDLSFRKGWNLISLPLAPMDSAAGVVLADAPPGNLDVQDVWSLAGGKYAAAELHACIGYWVYAARPTVLLVRGTPVAQTEWNLEAGFNLRGVATACPAPVDNRILGGIWHWDTATMRYFPVTELQPGKGYWIQMAEAATIPLPRDE